MSPCRVAGIGMSLFTLVALATPARANANVHIHFKNCTTTDVIASSKNGDDKDGPAFYETITLNQQYVEKTLHCEGKGHHRCWVLVRNNDDPRLDGETYYRDWIGDESYVRILDGEDGVEVSVHDEYRGCGDD